MKAFVLCALLLPAVASADEWGLGLRATGERVVRDVHDTVARALGSILVHLDGVGDPRRRRPDDADQRQHGVAPEELLETRGW